MARLARLGDADLAFLCNATDTRHMRKTAALVAPLVALLLLSGCLASAAIGVAGNVVEGAVNVTGDVAEGAVNTAGAVVSSDEDDDKEDDDTES